MSARGFLSDQELADLRHVAVTAQVDKSRFTAAQVAAIFERFEKDLAALRADRDALAAALETLCHWQPHFEPALAALHPQQRQALEEARAVLGRFGQPLDEGAGA